MNGQLAKVTQLHLIRPGGRCGMWHFSTDGGCPSRGNCTHTEQLK
jgi:hypothetical protein